MNELKVFEFEATKVRTVIIGSQPWVVVKDICEALHLSNPSEAIKSVDPDDLTQTEVIDAMGRSQTANVVNESGMYTLILRSDKPEAKAFKKWVTSIVLPSIRKTGSYTPKESHLLTDWQKEVEVIESFDRLFRPSGASKLGMFYGACKKHEMPTDLLPAYQPGEVSKSMSQLLQENGIECSVQFVNKRLVECGILEVCTRKSKSKGEKKYHSITEAGLAYGENLKSPQNLNETQPHWYGDKFHDLLKIAGVA